MWVGWGKAAGGVRVSNPGISSQPVPTWPGPLGRARGWH